MRPRILGRLGAALTCAAGVLLAVATAASVLRATVSYQTPAVMLVRADGKSVSLPHELDDGRPVLLNFIFTTCSSICPLTSRTLEEFQQKLGREAAKVHMVSISIDPEQDTPARLSEYARKFHAGPEWRYYTGTGAAGSPPQSRCRPHARPAQRSRGRMRPVSTVTVAAAWGPPRAGSPSRRSPGHTSSLRAARVSSSRACRSSTPSGSITRRTPMRAWHARSARASGRTGRRSTI